MDRVSLVEEFRLIERSENEVSGSWKGVHLLLFFLAFVFGSFCTFCFHMLMYLFDEKCVLFPKLLSLTSLRHNVIYEFIPEDKGKSDMLPVDFVSTQWVEKSACYLPTFVPLVSGIFGLVWTTMFLMCTTGTRTLSGLQRPWRMVPLVFIFSLAMGGLCIYSSTVTHYGLQELCAKLGEITGSTTCSYTVNVATLAYERRIRGVYQATQLTIISAWLHTSCWLLSAVLALTRILLAVDFQLVRISVELHGDLDKMLESHEEQIRTVSPGHGDSIETPSDDYILSSESSAHFQKRTLDPQELLANDYANLFAPSDILYFAEEHPHNVYSELSLVPEEQNKLARLGAIESLPKDKQFIAKMLYDLMDSIDFSESSAESSTCPSTMAIGRQFGQEAITSKIPACLNGEKRQFESVNLEEAEKVANEIKRQLQKRLYQTLVELPIDNSNTESPSTSKKKGHIAFDSSLNITSQLKQRLEDRLTRVQEANREEPRNSKKKSNLKSIGVQTGKKTKVENKNKQKVTISESKSTFIESSTESIAEEVEDDGKDNDEKNNKDDKDTQTRPKEKQD